ncbi:MAG: SDR family oxidoreductase [Rhodobacteraceae bacterium]|nr:SDR family oxidoreductase [Paracoccaceae bacterium]
MSRAEGQLAGRVALITGGAAGFGRDATRTFVAEGAKVVVVDVNAEAGQALADELGDAVRFVRADVRREDQMQAPVDVAVQDFGGLDVMYHNAGTVGSAADLDTISVDEWNASFEMLLTASMIAIKVATAPMKARGGGSIILTSSAAGYRLGGSGPYAYTIAKSAVCTMGQYAALKLGKHGIRVNVIVPGAFRTALWDKHDLGQNVLAEDRWTRMQPLPFAGQTQFIADTALYLASDQSRFVSGVVLPVDGGLTIHRNSFASAEG